MSRFLIAGLVLSGLAIAGLLGMILLPQVISARLTAALRDQAGLNLSHQGTGSVSIANGFNVVLSDVILTHGEAQSVPMLTVREVTIGNSIGLVFGGKMPSHITLDGAVLSLNQSATGTPLQEGAALLLPSRMSVRDSSLRIADSSTGLTYVMTDINGDVVSTDNTEVLIDARGLFNGLSTQATIELASGPRLLSEGTPADFAFAAGPHSLTFSGRVRAAGSLELDGVVGAQSDSLRDFLIWLGMPLAVDGHSTAFTLESPLSAKASRLDLSALTLGYGMESGTGNLNLNLKAGRPDVTGSLKLSLLDLNLRQSGEMRPPDLSTGWTERPFSFGDYLSATGAVAIEAEEVRLGKMTMEAAKLTLTVADGKLAVRINDGTLGGGKVEGQVNLGQDDTEAEVGGTLSFTGVEAQRLLGDGLGIPNVSGTLLMNGQFAASGGSPAALVSTLTGEVKASLVRGRLVGMDLPARVEAGAGAPQEGWQAQAPGDTLVNDMSLTLKLTDGVATFADSNVNTDRAAMALSGNVDVLRQALALTVTLPGGKNTLVSGPWTRPIFAPPKE